MGDYLSYEPYAIGLPKDEAFERMAGEGYLKAAYGRWFTQKLPTGETLDLPMSPHLAEMYRALGQPD